jgi:hypothetical protein
METLSEINELLTTKMCSPVIIYGVILVISVISVYLCRQTLKRYNTQKMENLYTLYTMQEIKFMLVLGVTMYGLCQYNKTELAWIFLIFPIIYVLIQNLLLYIHVSSAVQNAPQEQSLMQGYHYGAGLQAPLMAQQTSPPQTTSVPSPPTQMPSPEEYVLPKMTSQSNPMGGSSMFGGAGSQGLQGYNV